MSIAHLKVLFKYYVEASVISPIASKDVSKSANAAFPPLEPVIVGLTVPLSPKNPTTGNEAIDLKVKASTRPLLPVTKNDNLPFSLPLVTSALIPSIVA